MKLNQFVENGFLPSKVISGHRQDKMTDYTTDLTNYYKKINAIYDGDDIDCWEMSDWIEMVCEAHDINEILKEYVDFTQMLLNEDYFEIFVRHEDGTFQDIGYFIPSQTEWKKVAKKWIDASSPNQVFVIRQN